MPEEARTHADALVIGEAETTWPRLLDDAARVALQPEYRAADPPSLALNWGYRRAVDNALPGWPIPGGVRSPAVDWPA